MHRVAVAASGGADSIALQLEAARKFPPHHVTVLSVDHRTRPSAATERAHVAAIAAQLGFEYQELRIAPVRANQAAWRDARLDALIEYCRTHGIGTLWLGHHRDDAVETAVLRLLAGGNLSSLAGISAARQEAAVQVERPLLNRSSRQVRRELMAKGFGWYEDLSNRNDHYRRVAVRGLLSSDRERAKPASLVHRTAHWRAARELLLADAWRLAVRTGAAGSLSLNPTIMQRLPLNMAEALLRQAALLAAGREQRLRHAGFAAALASDQPPWQLGGVRVWAHQGQWLVGRDYRHVRDVVSLQPNSEIGWDARYRLIVPSHLPPGDWRVARLGLPAARGLRLDLPAEWAAAEFAIWNGPILTAVPVFDVWNGAPGTFWRENLTWNPLNVAEIGLFRVAP